MTRGPTLLVLSDLTAMKWACHVGQGLSPVEFEQLAQLLSPATADKLRSRLAAPAADGFESTKGQTSLTEAELPALQPPAAPVSAPGCMLGQPASLNERSMNAYYLCFSHARPMSIAVFRDVLGAGGCSNYAAFSALQQLLCDLLSVSFIDD